MSIIIKKHFTGVLKVVVVALCILSVLFNCSCKNKPEFPEPEQLCEEKDDHPGLLCEEEDEQAEPLSDEQISSNLVIDGDIDPSLLVGEWNLTRFARTTDGIKISNCADIQMLVAPHYDLEWMASASGRSICEVIDRNRPQIKIPDPPITPPKDEWYYWDDVNETWVYEHN